MLRIGQSFSHWGILVDPPHAYLCMEDWCEATGDQMQVFADMLAQANEYADLIDQDDAESAPIDIRITFPKVPWRDGRPVLDGSAY